MVMLLVLPAAAVAAPPLDVTIEVDEYLGGGGTFNAVGPAVDDGLLCATGITSHVEVKVSNAPPWGSNLTVVKDFTCGDGSGTFRVKLQVRLFNDGHTTFHWVVIGGTSSYATLHGSGSGVGSPLLAANDILDTYSGKMH
jgi:hypothetical protein